MVTCTGRSLKPVATVSLHKISQESCPFPPLPIAAQAYQVALSACLLSTQNNAIHNTYKNTIQQFLLHTSQNCTQKETANGSRALSHARLHTNYSVSAAWTQTTAEQPLRQMAYPFSPPRVNKQLEWVNVPHSKTKTDPPRAQQSTTRRTVKYYMQTCSPTPSTLMPPFTVANKESSKVEPTELRRDSCCCDERWASLWLHQAGRHACGCHVHSLHKVAQVQPTYL